MQNNCIFDMLKALYLPFKVNFINCDFQITLNLQNHANKERIEILQPLKTGRNRILSTVRIMFMVQHSTG